jgi:uncharacterized protein YggE
MTRNRIRAAVFASLLGPLVAAGCGAASRPSHAASRPAQPLPSQAVPQPGNSSALLATGPVDQTGGAAPAVSDPIVTTDGSGSASGTPEVMTLSIGVDTTASHAGEALSDCSAKATAVQQALQGDGVAAADIQTADLSLSPSYNANTATPSGYQATNTVVAKLRNLSKGGKVIDDAMAAAGDSGRLDGVSFALDDSSSFATAARKIAVAQARSRADELAAAAGMKVASLRSLSEQADQVPYGSFRTGVAIAGPAVAAPAVPIQPGVEQTTVNVTAVWYLTPA